MTAVKDDRRALKAAPGRRHRVSLMPSMLTWCRGRGTRYCRSIQGGLRWGWNRLEGVRGGYGTGIARFRSIP